MLTVSLNAQDHGHSTDTAKDVEMPAARLPGRRRGQQGTPLATAMNLRQPAGKGSSSQAQAPFGLKYPDVLTRGQGHNKQVREDDSQTAEINEPIPAAFDFFLILDLPPPEHVDLLALGFCSCHLQTSDSLQIMPGPNLPLQSVVVQTNTR